MNIVREVQDVWVAALRSGQYQQTKGALYLSKDAGGAPAGHCCLGVLTELFMQSHPGIVTRSEEACNYQTVTPDENGYCQTHDEFPPDEVLSWAVGFPCDGGRPDWADNAAGKNDRGFTFDEIATWIERGCVEDEDYA